MAYARKHVTVLFADISGFTAMSEEMDPEDVTTLMNGCLNQLADTVAKYEGYVDKFRRLHYGHFRGAHRSRK